MDSVERGVTVEAEPELEEALDSTLGFDSRRELVEFVTVVLLVMAIAAATSVVLLPV
jgi:hypothetical protein